MKYFLSGLCIFLAIIVADAAPLITALLVIAAMILSYETPSSN